jgi:hypothetical protein
MAQLSNWLLAVSDWPKAGERFGYRSAVLDGTVDFICQLPRKAANGLE